MAIHSVRFSILDRARKDEMEFKHSLKPFRNRKKYENPGNFDSTKYDLIVACVG